MIVNLQTVKEHLRVDGDSEDVLITLYMQAAEKHIENLLDDGIPGYTDSPMEPVPFPIKAAQLLIVADMYENRLGADEKDIKPNPAVNSLIAPYRKIGV